MLDIRRLFVLFALVALPIFILEVLAQYHLLADRRRETEAEASRLLNLIELEEQRTFGGIHTILATLSRTGTPQRPGGDCRRVLEELRTDLPRYLSIRIADQHGVIGCATDATLNGEMADDFPVAKEAVRNGRFVVGGFVAAPDTGRPSLSFALAYDGPDGARAGVLIALLDAAWLDNLIRLEPWPIGAAVLLTDRDGVVFSRVPERPGLVGTRLSEQYSQFLQRDRSGVAQVSGVDGVARIIAYSPIRVGTVDIFTVVGIGLDEAMAATNTAMWRSLTLFSGTLLLCIGGAAWGVRKIVHAHELASAVEHKMATVLSAITDIIVEVDRDWRVTFANEGARALERRSAGLGGLIFWDRSSDASEPAMRESCRSAMLSRTAVTFETYDVDAGRWYHVRGFPSVEGMIFYLKNITDRKAAEAALRRQTEQLRLAVSAASAGTFDMDPCTGTGTASQEFYLMHGMAPESAGAGMRAWAGHLHPDDQAAVQATLECAISDALPHYTLEYRVLHPNGRLHWVSMRGSAIGDDDAPAQRLVGITLDVTAQREREEDLRTALQYAEWTTQAKSRFIAVASHDLRQPVQSLFLFTALLRGQTMGERQQRSLSVIESSLTALKELLDGLFDLSRMESGAIKPCVEPFPLDHLLEEIATAYAPIVTGKGLEFQAAAPCGAIIRSDRVLLGRMLRNLIENANRYTSKGGIRLICEAAPDGLRIMVSDSGIGVPPEQLDRIFEEFHRVDTNPSHQGEGLGLGLSIVRRLSQLLDLPVSVTSEVGVGSTFTILIPNAVLLHDREDAGIPKGRLG